MGNLKGEHNHHWHIPQGRPHSWGYTWEPRTKTVAAVVFIVAVVSLSSLPLLLVTFLFVLGAALSMKLPGRALLRGLLGGGALVFLMAVTIILGNGLPVAPERLHFAGLLALKGLVSLTVMIMLLGTQPVEQYFAGLAHLGLPAVITSVLFLAYRYFFLLGDQLANTQRAAAARAFRPGTNRVSYKAYGEMAGGLFVKAIDRSEKISRALAARGFTGKMPTGMPAPVTAVDLAKGALTVAGAVILAVLDGRWPQC